jgi:hypothetical protein
MDSSSPAKASLRGSIPRWLQSVDGGVCQDLEVVDACRGTGVGNMFNKKFTPYQGACRGNFIDGHPIYQSTNNRTYMYAIDVYADNASVENLRGLTRWRIASLENFEDRTTCRREDANVNQVDFAALVQPYLFYPTIACFDRGGGSSTGGYESSTINIRCNDGIVKAPTNAPVNPASPSGSDDKDGISGGGKFAIVLVVFLILGGIGYIWWRKKRQSKTGDDVGDEFDSKFLAGFNNWWRKKRQSNTNDSDKYGSEDLLKETSPNLGSNRDNTEASPAALSSLDASDESSQKDEVPQAVVPVSSPRPPPFRKTSRRMSVDPPAHKNRTAAVSDDKDTKADEDDEAIPSTIRNMVSKLDNFLDSFGSNKEKQPSKFETRIDNFLDSFGEKKTKPRTRSLSPSGASKFAEKNPPTPAKREAIPRSRSRSPSGASKFAEKPKPRTRSISPSGASKFAEKPKPRTRSISPSGASKFAEKPKPRTRSISPSDASKFAEKPKPRTAGSILPSAASKFNASDLTTAQKSVPKKPELPGVPSKPNPNANITINPDGSIIVRERKIRADRVSIVEKTTYSNKKMAAKYGIHVS